MSTLSVIDDPYASLVFHTDSKVVHHKLYKDISSKTLRNVLNGGIDLLKQHHSVKWLSDNRDVNSHSPEDTEWINSQWLPNAVAAGWKYWALVVPHDFIARLNMSEFIDSFYEKGIRIMVFTDVDEAMKWLENL